jgi:hypothetical protein
VSTSVKPNRGEERGVKGRIRKDYDAYQERTNNDNQQAATFNMTKVMK